MKTKLGLLATGSKGTGSWMPHWSSNNIWEDKQNFGKDSYFHAESFIAEKMDEGWSIVGI